MDISVIILTYNEEKHIKRCLDSLLQVTQNIYIIDSFSTDDTVGIATKMGATVLQNKWVNYAHQFQWGLDNAGIKTRWVMRMDADEYVTNNLIKELNSLNEEDLVSKNLTGLYIKRQVHFMGRWIKHGGYYPVKLLRIWQFEYGCIEQRWMDEHIKLSQGATTELKNDIVDDNLNNLSWWTDKHNSYATREAIDVLNKKYDLFNENAISKDLSKKTQDKKVRWYKDNVFLKVPKFFRAFLYFHYRYFIKLGFLDGKPGLIWHFLQGFWYRFLVDAKIEQIEYISRTKNQSIKETIEKDFGFKL